MNIHNVEIKTGLTKRMIRHYEGIGLIRPRRNENNYREYSEQDVDQLLCVKALREVGFGLDDIGKIFKEGKTEDVLRAYLGELLVKQQEVYTKQKEQVQIVKRILNSTKNKIIDSLLDRIVSTYAPAEQNDVDTLEDFLRKHHVVHGNIKPFADFAKIASFGVDDEFKIVDTTYSTYQGVFEENSLPRASISLCKELYSYVLLFTAANRDTGGDFHKQVLARFSETWKTVASELTIKFDALTEDLEALEKLFSLFDLAVCITAENEKKERFQLVIPGQPLVVYLSQKTGFDYNNEDWLEK